MRVHLALAALLLLTACEEDEMAPESHHPEAAKLYHATSGAELTPSVQLPSGVTTRVRVAFFAADGDSIAGLATDHYAAVTVTPTTFATVTPVSGQRFHFDVNVTAVATTTAQLSIGYGHDTAADEEVFGPFTVTASVGAVAAVPAAGR